MTTLRAAVAAAWLGASLPAAAGIPVSHFVLDNGLELVVIEDHRAPVVTHMVWYRVGAADEPPGKSGIAHFLEHLMFKGTDEIPEGAFSRIIAANGGEDNAFTSRDQTAYFQRIAADRLEMVMRMEADRMRDLVLTEAVVAPERDVILEERNTRVENDPAALFDEQRQAAQFLNHPYGIPIIGWRHEIAALSRADALDFYRRYYAPNNAIVIVVGDVDPARVRRLAERHYGPLAPSADLPPRQRPQEPPQTAPRRLVFADARVRQPYVLRSYLAPERNPGQQRRAAALVLLARLLGGSDLTSVLGRALQVDSRIALGAGAFYDASSLDPSTFSIWVVPAPGVSLAEAEAAMDRAIAGFIANGPDPAHLERVRTQVRAAEIFALDNQMSLARRYGMALTSGLTLADVEEWPRLLQEVGAEEIVAAAREVLDLRRSVTGWLTSESEGEAAQ
ncbi:MAG: insulinase family protein [Alphaproteobacteria bacterium]|nr:MAG: insulinase family protein [Alphaproteobacteria bacterium]